MSDGALNYALGLSGVAGFVGGLGSATSALGNFAGRAVGLVGPLAGLTAGVGALGVAMKGLTAAADMESIVTSMGVLTGGTEKAKKLLDDLREMGASTPYEFPALATGAQTMLSFGIATEEILPLVKMLGDISMGSADKMGSLTLVMGQVASAGRLTGGDLLQFINAGFNPLIQIAEKTGESMSDLRKRMEEGGVSFAEVRDAMVAATSAGGAFFGMMGKMAGTTQGLVSTLKDEVNNLFLAFGQPINDAIKPILTDAISQVSALRPQIASIGEAAATGLSRVYAAAASGQLGALLEAELLYAGAVFVNFLGEGFHEVVKAGAGIGQFLGEAMVGAGDMLKGALLDAAGAFAARFGEMLIEPIASVLDFIGRSGEAKSLRSMAAFAAQEQLNKDATAAKESGKQGIAGAFDKFINVAAGGKVFDADKMAELESDRNEVRTVLDRQIRAEAVARAKAAEEADALAKAEAECAAAVAKQETALTKATAQVEAAAPTATPMPIEPDAGMAGGDAPGVTGRIRLFNAQDSALRRAARMSAADRDGSGLDYLKGKGLTNPLGGPSGLDYLKGTGLTPGGVLAAGAQVARDAGATLSPKARALGETNRAAREKPDASRDLAAILRKIEENTAAFAEVALAT
jgi:tape measure domain-containing protein